MKVLFDWLKHWSLSSQTNTEQVYPVKPATKPKTKGKSDNLLVQVGPPPLLQPQLLVHAPPVPAP